jgi:ABC-type multidrug transport system fused ATPase/permease subunit
LIPRYYSYAKCAAVVGEAASCPAAKGRTTLAFENIRYTLKGRPILKGISGVAPAGELLAIMGPSGSGAWWGWWWWW